MTEIVPSNDDYHRAQIIKVFRAAGRYVVESLIEAGKCMSLRVSETETPVSVAITNYEINDFARRCETSEFDHELAILMRETPTDI